jgi:hypothetical protein
MAVPTADSTPRTDSESAGLRWTSAGVRQIEVRGEHRRTSRGEHRRTVRQVMSAADTSGHKPADKLADTNRRTESKSAADNFVSASVRGGLRLGGRDSNLSVSDSPPDRIRVRRGQLCVNCLFDPAQLSRLSISARRR